MHDRIEIDRRPRAGIYHGWAVVAAAFVVAMFGFGLGFYGPGIYLVAFQDRHGWPAAELSYAVTAYYLLGATSLFFWVGPLFDRWGARVVIVIGAAALSGGLVLLGSVSEQWQIYLAFAVMSVGWATMSGAAINIIVAPWFDRRRGRAISLTTAAAVAGRIVTGFFVDRVDRRIAACGNFIVQALGTATLALGTTEAALYTGCILFIGNMTSLPGLIAQQEFPKQHFARVISLIVAINQFSFAFGPSLLGQLQQASGSYPAALCLCLAMQLAAAAIVLSVRRQARQAAVGLVP